MAAFVRFRSATGVLRFRSGDRDRATDQQRLEGVTAAIQAAMLSIEQEEGGLKRRLEEASNRAAAIAGTDPDAYLDRDPAEETLLSEAERQMMSASRRLQQLREQHQLFARMLESLGNALGAATSR